MGVTLPMKIQYIISRAYYFEILGNKCNKCNSLYELEIDHIYFEDKHKQPLSFCRSKLDFKKLIKCQLLCNSCHKLKTSSDRHRKSLIRKAIKLNWRPI